MKKLGEYMKWYLYITTCILIVCAIIVTFVYKEESISVAFLWQILGTGLLTTTATVLIRLNRCITRHSYLFGLILHYVVLCVIMIFCGTWFGWMHLDASGVLMMVLAVAGVYILSYGAYSIIDLRQADSINKRLKEKYGDNDTM